MLSILNMNENTVKTRLVRARVQLKQEYTSAEDNIQKERLQQKKKKINREAFTTDNQQDIQGKEQKQGDRGYRPSQHAMGNILKTEDSIT